MQSLLRLIEEKRYHILKEKYNLFCHRKEK